MTQTTLSLDDTAEIVAVLKRRFPAIVAPHKEDICYATTNRQEAVKRVAPQVDALVVVGAPNSSNSRRLQEVAERAGCSYSVLVQRAAEIDWSRFEGVKTLGVTAGASAPEVLVEEILDAFAARYTLNVETVSGADESGMFFPLPRQLARQRGGLVSFQQPLDGSARRRAVLDAWPSTPTFPPKTWDEFLADYDLGELLSYKGIAEGVENSNFLVHTGTGHYILTLYEKRVAAGDVPFFLALMEHLAARGITCPQPVKNRNGKALGKLCGRPAAIVTFLDGMWMRRPDAGHCAAVGEALARMHLAGGDFAGRRRNALSVAGLAAAVRAGGTARRRRAARAARGHRAGARPA